MTRFITRKATLSILLLTFFAVPAIVRGQNNPLGADDKFYSLLTQMGPELKAGETISTSTMLANVEKKIDDNLAYEYLWRKNQFVKPEESHCHPIGYVLNKESNVAVLLFFKGERDNLVFWVEIMTYNYKKGKMVDQLVTAGAFNEEGTSACTIEVNSPNLVIFKNTTLVGNTQLDIKMNNKGVIDRK